MKKRLFVTTLVGALLIATGTSALAAQTTKPFPPEKHCCNFIPGYEQLTPEKKAFLEKTMKESREKMHAQGSMLFAKTALLNAELAQPTINKQAVAKLSKEINDLQLQLLQERVDTIIKVKENTGIVLPLKPQRPMFVMKKHREEHKHPAPIILQKQAMQG